MAAVFLSASVPTRGGQGFEGSDPYLIREAVSALVEVVLGRKLLVWGGHPAITPMIWAAAKALKIDYGAAVHLFQSKHFEDAYPEDNARFRNVTYVEEEGTREESLRSMRMAMLTAFKYDAAVFIGGMEGILEERDIFIQNNPRAIMLPVPGPGGVAREMFLQSGLVTPGFPQESLNFTGLFYSVLGVRTSERRATENLAAAAARRG